MVNYLNKEDKIMKLIKRKKNLSKFERAHFNYALTKYIFSDLCKSYSKIFNIKCRIIKLFHIYGRDDQKRLWPLLNSYQKIIKILK